MALISSSLLAWSSYIPGAGFLFAAPLGFALFPPPPLATLFVPGSTAVRILSLVKALRWRGREPRSG